MVAQQYGEHYVKMRKLLIVGGCSWSNINFKSELHPELDTSWPKWHELLADMLDLELVSLGINGAGQEYIFNSLVEYITELDNKDKIGLVMPAWSRSPRRDYQIYDKWRNNRFDACGDAYYMVKRSLRYFYQFQIFCERFNLPYKQIHMLDSTRIKDFETPDSYDHGKISHTKIDHTIQSLPFYNKINEEKFLGAPLIRAFGGYALDQHVIGVSKKKYRISDVDFHPNKIGNKLLASYIYENL